MKDHERILADKCKRGEPVSLYCDGILASHMIHRLKKFHHVLPSVIIDNDGRKRGTGEFGIPVMPFVEARERFQDLQYFICSDDFKYTIIGDMLEKGVPPEAIINYVPVEKRRTCLYFYNRLLLVQGREEESHYISHCNVDSFKPQTAATQVPEGCGDAESLGNLLDTAFVSFESGSFSACRDCVMNREQYMVARDHPRHYKSVALYQADCGDCLSHCVYCCVGGNNRSARTRMRSLESYGNFLDAAFALDRLDEDFTCALDLSERDYDRKIGLAVDSLERAGLTPLVYKVNSCLLLYSERLAGLIRQGMVYVIWSLDAGTRETYRRVKQIDTFDKALENVRRYIAQDPFHGGFIVAKYLIVKGVNDYAAEFDAFLQIILDIGLRFVSLSFDFAVQPEKRDLIFIQDCYDKILKAGLKLTYKNNSAAVAKALQMNTILSQ